MSSQSLSLRGYPTKDNSFLLFVNYSVVDSVGPTHTPPIRTAHFRSIYHTFGTWHLQSHSLFQFSFGGIIWLVTSVTPLVFGTNEGMGLDRQKISFRLWKNDEPYASVISWLRIQLSFAILRTVHRCVRGSRYPFKSREVSEVFTFAVAGLHLHS